MMSVSFCPKRYRFFLKFRRDIFEQLPDRDLLRTSGGTAAAGGAGDQIHVLKVLHVA